MKSASRVSAAIALASILAIALLADAALWLTPADLTAGESSDAGVERARALVVARAADVVATGRVVDLRMAAESFDRAAWWTSAFRNSPQESPADPRDDLYGAVEDLAAAHGAALPQNLRELLIKVRPDNRRTLVHVITEYMRLESEARSVFGDVSSAPPGPVHAAVLARQDALLNLAMSAKLSSNDPVVISVPPALVLSLGETDDTYAADAVLLVDDGGSDTYINNAGGNNFAGGACLLESQVPAAALFDFGGDDQYASDGSCGVNGGGNLGAGFLYDRRGNDSYRGRDVGVNGGGQAGVGLLFDGGGDDTYIGQHSAVNGGGALGGTGRLIDRSGNDFYHAGSVGVNGGAASAGVGILVDGSGNDRYRGFADGVNGGSALGLSGFLLDLGGDDDYRADVFGTNGGATTGTGFLLDTNGNDTYRVLEGQSANGGAQGGVGILIDLAGNDNYLAGKDACLPLSCSISGSGSVNGGAEGDGFGFLADLSGNDRYIADDSGVNGGGFDQGAGFLLDASGDDEYRAGREGVNGSGVFQGIGCLLDLAGSDLYIDLEWGEGQDVTIVPKGTGAQVDSSASLP